MSDGGGVGPERFRSVLRHVPTSVTVVASLTADGPKGLSIGTFVPVSLEPPLVGFFVARSSTTWPSIEGAGAFCVSVLAEHQADLSRRFSVQGGEKFDGVAWHEAPSGHPILAGAVAWVDCTLADVHPAGDHVLVLGAVVELGTGSGLAPLLHHGGGYRRAHDLEPALEDASDARSGLPDGGAGPDLASGLPPV